MPELRKDPIINRWVIIATERQKRPSDFPLEAEEQTSEELCPFCPGREDKTPPEILSYRDGSTKPNKPGWWIRVVANKYPALIIEGTLDKRGDGIYDQMNGIGAHEVIIETPDHNLTLPDLELKFVEDVIWVYRDRIVDLKKDRRFKYILIFKNHGRKAGASLSHSHSQLIATPIVPKRVAEEIEWSKRYYNYKERCVYCDMVKQELSSKIRLVQENNHFIAFTPFASRFPFETWLLPKRHDNVFEDIQKTEVSSLAQCLKRTLQRLNKALNKPAYNFILHNSPLDTEQPLYYHWHIEIMPKLTNVAGFEWGTGFYINPTSPEEAAKFLREIKI